VQGLGETILLAGSYVAPGAVSLYGLYLLRTGQPSPVREPAPNGAPPPSGWRFRVAGLFALAALPAAVFFGPALVSLLGEYDHEAQAREEAQQAMRRLGELRLPLPAENWQTTLDELAALGVISSVDHRRQVEEYREGKVIVQPTAKQFAAATQHWNSQLAELARRREGVEARAARGGRLLATVLCGLPCLVVSLFPGPRPRAAGNEGGK
jgi:hypothetical protein